MNLFTIFAAVLLLSILRTHPSTAQQSQLDCSDKLDVFFALDASDSLTETQFEQEKQLVNNLLQRLIDTNRDAKAGYLTFTQNINNVRNLDSDIDIVRFELMSVVFDSEGTSLFAPLNYVYQNIFNSSNTALRPDSRRIFFQITDGRDEDSTEAQLADISRRLLLESNVTTIAIGLGQLIETDQLNAIATDPDEQNVIVFSDFSQALENISDIFDRTCTIPPVDVLSAEKLSGDSITVRWTTYNFTTVFSYKICFRIDRQSPSCNFSVQNIDFSSNERIVKNLTTNVLYYIMMFAFTNLGVTPISSELQIIITDIPGPPLQLRSTAVTANSISVAWDQPSVGFSIDSYRICFSLTAGGSCAFEGLVSGSLAYTQNGLSQNIVYFIRVQAVNSGGAGNYSAEITERTGNLPALSIISVEPASFHQIKVTWTSYTAAAVISYEICVRLIGMSDCVQNVTVAAPATIETISRLSAFTTYQVSVVAVTSLGRSQEGNSSQALIRTGEFRPGVPTNLTATSLSPSSIQVIWSPPPPDMLFGIITQYYICVRKESGEGCLFLLEHLANETLSRTVSFLDPGITYRVRVRAQNGGGTGGYTSDISVTTDPLGAVTITAAIENVNYIRVNWTAVPIEPSRIIGAVIYLRTSNSSQVFTLSQSQALSMSYLIGQIQPASMYILTMVVNTTVGDTPLSDEVIIVTQESLPTASPTVIEIINSSTSFTVIWNAIPLMQQNGKIISYNLYYKVKNDTNFTVITVLASTPPMTHTIPGLTPNTLYLFAIDGENSAGRGPSAGNFSVRTATLGAIQGIALTSTSQTITITFEEYTETTVIEYIVCLSMGGSGTCEQNVTVTGLNATFYGLLPAREYNVTIIARTSFGDTPSTQPQTTTTSEAAPGSPSNIVVNITSAVSIQITTTPIPADQLNGVLIGYFICIKQSGDQNCTFEQTVGPNTQTFTVSQDGLRPNTTYIIIVRGYNAIGQGTYNPITITTDRLQAVVISVSVVDAYRINLYWTDSNVPCNYTTGAIVYVTNSSGTTPFTLTQEQAQSKNITIEGFNPATTYYFILKLVTIVGTTPPSIEVSEKTLEAAPSGSPVNVRSEVISATSIKIIWSAPPVSESNGFITVYTICFGNVSLSCVETVVNASQTLEYIYEDLTPKTTYVFQVRAHTAIGPGPYSAIQNQTTPAPGALVIESISAFNATAVSLSWSRLNITVVRYTICVRESESGTCVYTIQITNETQVSTLITNLEEYTTYYIVVTAITQSGFLVASPVRSVRTLEDAPSSHPSPVTAVSIMDTSVTISWGEVAERDRNGIITAYEVCIQLSSTDICTNTSIIGDTTRQSVISGLTSNTSYIIRVRAYTAIGEGPYSPALTVRTLELRPEQPDVNVTSDSQTSVTIVITTPQTGGRITSYRICISLLSDSECIVNRTISTTEYAINITIDSLSTYTVYRVVVIVIGPGGESESQPETITTQRGIPDAAVSAIQITSPSTTSLEVTWEPLLQINWNDESVQYIVTIRFGGVVISSVQTTSQSFIFTGLQPNTMYEIIVIASNSVGQGPSNSSTGFTQQEPAGEPEVEVISETTIKITVRPDSTSNTSVPTKHYEICVKLSTSDPCDPSLSRVLPGNETTINITDTRPNTMYIITVIEVTINDERSPPSTPVVITTDPLAPIDPVLNLQGEVTNLFEMVLSWEFNSSSQESAPTHFRVCLAEVQNGSCNISRFVTSNIRIVSITVFEAETKYYISVSAWNIAGNGPAATTELTTPGRPPVDLTFTAITVSAYEIYVEWESRELNRNVLYFSINIAPSDTSGSQQTRYNLSIDSGAFVFSSLTPNTSYTISILELPKVDDAIAYAQTFPEGIADSPIRVEVTTISSTLLRVTWEASDSSQTDIQTWEVCYVAETFTQSNGCDMSSGSDNYLTIIDLEEYESYTVTVRAIFTNGNTSQFSVPATGRTAQDVPSRGVSELKYVTNGGENKYVWLSPPLIHHNGIIVYYLVEFAYEEDGEVETIEYYVSPKDPEVDIPYMVKVPYNVSVVPYTIGPGEAVTLIGTDNQPSTGPAVCTDARIVITILCIVLALLIVLAIFLCCGLLIVLFKKRGNSYSAV